jgi:pyridoxal phosphate enzyme (YggS family)
MIAERIRHIEQRMADACIRAGRPVKDVRLVVVTKTQSAETVNAALQSGITEIGENRVQEYVKKREALESHHLHMIGHLQRNKVKYIIGGVAMIHSVDSLALAEEISRRSMNMDLTTDILLEVNTSGEKSKNGIAPDEAGALVRDVLALPNLRLQGLMTVAEFFDDPERVRPAFRLLRTLRDEAQAQNPGCTLPELSMGMTNDFEVAIEEGATLVRIGSAIFGPRQ